MKKTFKAHHSTLQNDLQVGDVVTQVDDDGIRITVEREVPDIVMPTEPYTVIRVTWRNIDMKTEYVLTDDSRWRNINSGIYASKNMVDEVESFEVLASPQQTAKQVLDAVENAAGYEIRIVSGVRRQFNVADGPYKR